ncbi:16634_t:CDS:2 [Dentiscutata erythropus]|uniref:16634_t:CDS:1 n=1 Tax=Dentiscutata erythropus TaxID=1348616 RepID=A0A9N9EL69_9GLOM|nr:16634_t:CDS:2 [Dentiscutata erythropus]
MPCYADTIVRVKYVKQNVKDDTNTLVVWALGVYPVYREDYNLEMTLFVLVNSDVRDPESQAVFVKDNFFSVGGKIIPRFYEGNKRAKEVLNIVKEDTIVQILVSDYVGQEDNIWPKESFIFIVGQLEIIKNEFYVYAREINCIDTQFNSKKNFDRGISHRSSIKNSIRSKLLATHDNFAKCLKGVSERGIEDFDESAKEFCNNFAENSKASMSNDDPVMLANHSEDFDGFIEGDCKRSSHSKDKERVDGPLQVNLRSHGLDSNIDATKE